jgi:hypothetical protein
MSKKNSFVQDNGDINGNLKKVSISKKYKYGSCERCTRTIIIDQNAVSGLCWICVAKLVPPPDIKSETGESKFPPGWRFMTLFVDYQENVYKYGEECPELKGTLPVTDVDTLKMNIKLKKLENKKKRIEREEKLKEKENTLRVQARKETKVNTKVVVKRKK